MYQAEVAQAETAKPEKLLTLTLLQQRSLPKVRISVPIARGRLRRSLGLLVGSED